MSDDKGREMRVVVEGGKQEVERLTKRVDELEPKAQRFDKIVYGLIADLNKRYSTDEFSEMTTVTELMELEKEFAQAELQDKRNRRPASKGTVSLHNPREGENDFFTREYGDDEAKEFIADLFSEWRNEENVEKRIQIRKHILELFKKKDANDDAFRNIKWVFDRVPEGLNPKAGWREFTTHAQEKHKNDLERQRK